MSKEKKPNVIAICGSIRKDGNTERFLQRALDIISEYNIDTELITLCDKYIELDTCVQCSSPCDFRPAVCITHDDCNQIIKKMIEADGIILGAPVYWGGISGKMKELLNRAGTISEGRISAKKPLRIIGGPELWPETTKGPGVFARKVGGAIAVAQRDGTLFTISELLLWFLINNFIICSSNYWVDGLEQVGRTGKGGIGGGGTRIPSEAGSLEHVRDILEVDREAAMTLDHFAENFSWLVNTTYKIRGTPEEIFKQSRLSSPKYMDPQIRKIALDEC